MDARPLHPNLGFYRKAAKELHRALAAREPIAAARFAKHHPRFSGRSANEVFAAQTSLADAQLVIAREQSCSSWADFKDAVARAELTPQEGPADQLMRAVGAADLQAVRALLAQHPGIAAQRDRAGTLPLVAACDRGLLEISRALLDAGAGPRTGDPLLAAAHPGPHKREPAIAVVELLLERGAPDDIFTHAVLGRTGELERDLATAPDLEARGPAGATVLFLAAWNGHLEATRLLLAAGARPNTVRGDGQSLWRAVFSHSWSGAHRAIAVLLVDHGASCTFHEACVLSHTATIRRMLALDPALADRPDDDGVAPTSIALRNADAELARILLDAGAADPKGRARAFLTGARHEKENLSGSVFRDCALARVNFHNCTLADATFSDVNLSGIEINNVNLSGARIDNASIKGLTIYGIEVEPLLVRELRRRAARKAAAKP